MELSLSRRPLGAWLFGKLPAHGDFVARGLDHDMRDGLDAWLAKSMAAARERWDESAFEARYFSAPPWRFVDVDPMGAMSAGAACLSVDGVGRKFPFLVAQPVASSELAREAGRACVELGFSAIAERWGADRVCAAAAVPSDAAGEPDAGPRWLLDSADGPIAELEGRFPERLVETMLEHAL